MTQKNRSTRLIQRVTRLLLVILCVWILAVSLAWLLQDRLIFPRWLANGRALSSTPSGVEAWTKTTDTGDVIEAWFLPADTSQPAPLLVVTHGNAELIDDYLERARDWTKQGVHVLLPEYRGYGRSTGTPSQEAIVNDVCAWIDHARSTRTDIDPHRLAMLGNSIGTAVASQVATQRTPSVMAFTVPPARIDSMAWRYGIPGFLVASPFRSDLALQQIAAPVLIVSRDRDELIPSHHGAMLRDAAPNATLHVVGGTHNNADDLRSERRMIQTFILEHLNTDTTTAPE